MHALLTYMHARRTNTGIDMNIRAFITLHAYIINVRSSASKKIEKVKKFVAATSVALSLYTQTHVQSSRHRCMHVEAYTSMHFMSSVCIPAFEKHRLGVCLFLVSHLHYPSPPAPPRAPPALPNMEHVHKRLPT